MRATSPSKRDDPMTIKTAFLAGAAAVLMTSAPALAQDAPASASPEASAAQPQSLTLTPGATVKGSDGAENGRLVGVQNNATGEQELTVRGADGQVRAVPLPGIPRTARTSWSAGRWPSIRPRLRFPALQARPLRPPNRRARRPPSSPSPPWRPTPPRRLNRPRRSNPAHQA